MSKIEQIKSFLISRIFGLILIIFSISIAVSFFYFSETDPTYGNVSSININDHPLGSYGSYIAGFCFIFFDNSSYLIPLFFLAAGVNKVAGFQYKYFIIKLFGFFIGLILINLFLNYVSLADSVVGNFFKNILNNYLSETLKNKYYFYLFLFLIFIFSILFIVYSLSIRLFFVLSFFQKLLTVFIYIFRSLFIFRMPKFKFSKNVKQKSSIYQRPNNLGPKKEPTIRNNNFESKNLEKQGSTTNYENEYVLPPLSLLKTTNEKLLNSKEYEKTNLENSDKLEKILKEYGVEGKIINYKTGPVITLYEFNTAAGIKTSKVVSLSEDIARAMASVSTRISSQPGKSTIGIEIPNPTRQNVYLGDLIKDKDFYDDTKNLTLALGKSISGEKKYTDLEKMPHLLIAGTTGSGKSVGINSMILSILFKFKPSECKLILIDPKMLELSVYENIPHLLSPVVTNPNKAVFALKWVVNEMENRYKLMSSTNVKNIQSFNEKIELTLSKGQKLFKEVQTGIDNDTRQPIIEKKEIPLEKLPLIVVVIDEMADLMMVAGKEVENLVQRLAQMARASGIHLITATQRPSVDVITGTIKANFPSRISFRVASRFDSRTILNEMGAEQLLGSGDMLFLENGANLVRLHGGYVSENEIENVVKFINSQAANETRMDITNEKNINSNEELDFNLQSKNVDDLYEKAVSIVIDQQKVSTSFVQRYLQIGYNRAARIVEQMEEDGIISEPTHAGKRSVLKKTK